MSQATVAFVIDKLTTDRLLLARFTIDRIETLAELVLHGCDLTADEIDLFYRTDPGVWMFADGGEIRH